MEVLESVRQVWPDNLPVFVRISATEWVDGGWNEADSIGLAKILQTKGVDLLDCSSGGNVPNVRITVKPLYQLSLSANIKKSTGILTGAVGLITTPEEAENIITNQEADLVFMAREFLRDPHFPQRAAFELNAETPWPKQYERARKKRV